MFPAIIGIVGRGFLTIGGRGAATHALQEGAKNLLGHAGEPDFKEEAKSLWKEGWEQLVMGGLKDLIKDLLKDSTEELLKKGGKELLSEKIKTALEKGGLGMALVLLGGLGMSGATEILEHLAQGGGLDTLSEDKLKQVYSILQTNEGDLR
jgi:hypothetical protein